MKYTVFIALATAVLLVGCASGDEPGNNERTIISLSRSESEAVMTQNEFSFRLLTNLEKLSCNEDNIIISPLGVTMDLGMIAAGASEEDAMKVYNALGYGMGTTVDDVNSANKRLLSKIQNMDRKTKVRISNSLWIDKSLTPSASFIRECKENYSADIFNVDLCTDGTKKKINKWASDQTNGYIKEALDGRLVNVDLSFINTIYFNGKWNEGISFNKDNTKPEQFTNISGEKSMVDMMHAINTMVCWKDDSEIAVRTFYGNRTFCITFVLPNEDVTLQQSLASMDAVKIADWEKYGIGYSSKVDLALPRFNVESHPDLTSALQEMGIDLFERIMLPRVTESPINIGHLFQHSKITVNEEGTQVASVTYTNGVTCPGPLTENEDEVVVVRFDRPFYYWISETSTNTILAIGTVKSL